MAQVAAPIDPGPPQLAVLVPGHPRMPAAQGATLAAPLDTDPAGVASDIVAVAPHFTGVLPDVAAVPGPVRVLGVTHRRRGDGQRERGEDHGDAHNLSVV